jgi:hypothetical protein
MQFNTQSSLSQKTHIYPLSFFTLPPYAVFADGSFSSLFAGMT